MQLINHFRETLRRGESLLVIMLTIVLFVISMEVDSKSEIKNEIKTVVTEKTNLEQPVIEIGAGVSSEILSQIDFKNHFLTSGVTSQLMSITKEANQKVVAQNICGGLSNAMISIEENDVDIVEASLVEESAEIIEEESTEEESSVMEIFGTEVPKTMLSAESNFSKFDNQTDIYLLAQIIYFEAGNCPKMDMYATGCVVLNRARTSFASFGNTSTINQVLRHPGQYGSETIRKVNAGYKPSDDAIKVAKKLIKEEIPCLDEAVLFQAGSVPSYTAERIQIPGTSGKIVYSKIKYKYFKSYRKYKNMQ